MFEDFCIVRLCIADQNVRGVEVGRGQVVISAHVGWRGGRGSYFGPCSLKRGGW
jgi:hypothetical protein